MAKWFQTGTEFKEYMDVSGVGDSELEEAIYKPLVGAPAEQRQDAQRYSEKCTRSLSED
jgi:hypothetical protein